ncbi:MAG: MerR family transcriptional regulator [Pseudomonadota bacterium]
MKMKELEARTGVGREAIRFYIREGLLPEPERPKKNVARYSDDHVIRIKAIKRLQEERFLPLAVIKALLAADGDIEDIDRHAFPALDLLLHAKLDGPLAEPVSLAELQAQTGLDDRQIEDMHRVGIIAIQGKGAKAHVDARDAAIARRWAQLRDVGFTEERGFDAETSRIYVEFVDWLTRAEVQLFYRKLADKLSLEEAARIGERGVTIVNEAIGLMRTRAILRALEALNVETQDKKTKPRN